MAARPDTGTLSGHESGCGVSACGFLSVGEIASSQVRVATIDEKALAGFGWVEGKNIRIDYRFTAGDPTLFKTYAARLVGLSPDVILVASTRGSRRCGSRRARYRSFS
jgi:hypothetical protein